MKDLARIFRGSDKSVRCPLCHGFFDKRYDEARRVFVLLCERDKIGIRCDDPFVGTWDQAYAAGEKIMCHACNSEMRYFATSKGFIKTKCPKPKCAATQTLSEVQADQDVPTETAPDAPGELQ